MPKLRLRLRLMLRLRPTTLSTATTPLDMLPTRQDMQKLNPLDETYTEIIRWEIQTFNTNGKLF